MAFYKFNSISLTSKDRYTTRASFRNQHSDAELSLDCICYLSQGSRLTQIFEATHSEFALDSDDEDWCLEDLLNQELIVFVEEREIAKRNRIFETVNGTKKDAEKRLREIQNQIDGRSYINKSDQTLSEWLDEWLTLYIGQTHSPNTLHGYRSIINGCVKPKLGNIRLQALTTTQLQRFYNEIRVCSPMSQKPISAATVKNIHRLIHAALNQALKLGFIPKNPDHDVQLPKPKRYVATTYNGEEIKQLIEYAKGTDMELAVHMLLCLGLRRSELIGLKWCDVDWDNSKITVSRSLVLVDNKVVMEKSPKTDSSNRTIDMPLYLVKMLKQAEIDYKYRKVRHGRFFNDNGYIISLDDGSPYKPHKFSDKFRRFIKKSNLKYIRLHDMRHTNATLMLSLGISPKVAQKRLGHSSFAVTMDTYSHVLDEIGREAADKIEISIFGEKKDDII